MIINNKSVRGIYLYDSSVTYEKNDFLVFGNKLYIVKSKEVTGIIPSESDTEHYRLYLSEDFATTEEIANYLSGKGTDETIGDKLVTVSDLCNILSKFLGGINYEGEITNRISPDNTIITDYFGNEVEKKYDSSENPLDIILMQPELNNAIFFISREVAVGIVPDDEEDHKLVLRQYTYSDGDNSIRMQEIIDFSIGNISVRYATKSNSIGSIYSGVTSWKSCYQKSKDIDNLIELKNKYYLQNSKSILQNKVLENNYKYSSISISNGVYNDGSNTYTYSYGLYDSSFNYPNIYIDNSTTSLLSTFYFTGAPMDNGIQSVGSITLDIIPLLSGSNGEMKIYIPDLSSYDAYVVFKTGYNTNAGTGDVIRTLGITVYFSSGQVSLSGFYIKKQLNSEFTKISGHYDTSKDSQKIAKSRGLTTVETQEGKVDFSNEPTYDRYVFDFTIDSTGKKGSIPIMSSSFSSDQHYYFMINLQLRRNYRNEHDQIVNIIVKPVSMLIDLYEYLNNSMYSVKQDVIFENSVFYSIEEISINFENITSLTGSGISAVVTVKNGSVNKYGSNNSAPTLTDSYFCPAIKTGGIYNRDTTPTIDIYQGTAVFYNNIV